MGVQGLTVRADLTGFGYELEGGGILGAAPEPLPSTEQLQDKVAGMLLGVAIGDALGAPTEGWLPEDRREAFGQIRDYLNHRRPEARGYPTDDTQLTFWMIEQLLEDGSFLPGRLAEKMANRRIQGIGSSVLSFLHSLEGGAPWHEAGAARAGNGALMAIAPVLLPHLRNASAQLWADAYVRSYLTHRDPASCSACVAWAGMLWDLLGMSDRPARGWYVDRYVSIARGVEGETEYEQRSPGAEPWIGPLWRLVEERVPPAVESEASTVDLCDRFYSGAYLLETVPCALLILERHGHDPEEAIVRAVNDTKDNDTVAAIVGSAVGALHGTAGLPERWITGLTGRTRHHQDEPDDGRVFELVAQAIERFC